MNPTFDVKIYIENALRYSLFDNPDQNNEYTIRLTDKGIIFIPIYPLTYTIDESFYNKVFSILNLALTPAYTLVHPLTMQIVNLPSSDISRQRGLFFQCIKDNLKGLLKA